MKKKKNHFLRIGHEKSDAFLISLGMLFLVGAFVFLMRDTFVLGMLGAAIGTPKLLFENCHPDHKAFCDYANANYSKEYETILTKREKFADLQIKKLVTLSKKVSPVLISFLNAVNKYGVTRTTPGGAAIRGRDEDWDDLIRRAQVYLDAIANYNRDKNDVNAAALADAGFAYNSAFDNYNTRYGGDYPHLTAPQDPKEGPGSQAWKDWQKAYSDFEDLQRGLRKTQEALDKIKGDTIRNHDLLLACQKAKNAVDDQNKTAFKKTEIDSFGRGVNRGGIYRTLYF